MSGAATVYGALAGDPDLANVPAGELGLDLHAAVTTGEAAAAALLAALLALPAARADEPTSRPNAGARSYTKLLRPLPRPRTS